MNKKKNPIISMMLICVMLTSFFGMSAKAENTNNEASMVELLIDRPIAIVDSQIIKIDTENEDVTPVIINDRTLVPVRFISESFGMDVSWDEIKKKVTLSNNNYNIEIVIGELMYKVNGDTKELDVPATIVNERTMLPLRAMAEAIGKQVYWEDGYICISNEEFAWQNKVESHKWQMQAGSNEYGVRFKLIEDEDVDYYEPCERLGACVGMNVQAETPEQNGFSDFDAHYPWSDMKLCSLKLNAKGEMIKFYKGENGFESETNNIFVEIPKFYIKRYIEDGYEYRYISETKKDGYIIDPTFVENGKELDYVYVSAYEGGQLNGYLVSASGVFPMTERTRPEFIELAKERGKGFGIFDIRTLMTVQNLYLVEFADKNSQKTIGNGWSMCLQPYKNYASLLDEFSTNRVVVKNTPSLIKNLFVGSSFLIVSAENNKTIHQRTITQMTEDEENGNLIISFDGSPVNITKQMYIGAGAQKTGTTDSIDYHTGRTDGHGDDSNFLYRTGVKYRHMENLWGNVWHYLDGINIKNGKTVFSVNMNEYNVNSKEYIAHNIEQKYQSDNATVGGKTEIHYLKNLGYDEKYPWLALPRDYMYEDVEEIEGGSQILRENSFGDYYYLNEYGASNYVHGGGFDHYWRCGLFTLRGWQNETRKWYLYGTRLIYKQIP